MLNPLISDPFAEPLLEALGARAASDYLAVKGWTATTERTTALFGRYGLALPEGRVTPFGDPVYVTAIR